MKNHTSDRRTASVWAILPAGVRENVKVEMWDAVLTAYVVDRV